MAADPPALTVVYSFGARRELGEIWDWNAEKYGAAHASDYVAFLEKRIQELATRYEDGRFLAIRPELRQIVFRRSRNVKAHAHVVVYQIDATLGRVNVLHIFHTAQDIGSRLRDN